MIGRQLVSWQERTQLYFICNYAYKGNYAMSITGRGKRFNGQEADG